MGKYRTFSSKVFHFESEFGVVDDSGLLHGNGRNNFRLRRRNEWQKRIKRGPQLQQVNLLNQSSWLSLVFIVGGILFLAQPASSSSVSSLSIVDDEIEAVGEVEGYGNFTFSNSSSWVEYFAEIFASRQQRNCTLPSSNEFPADLFTKEERQHGAIAIHFFVSFYLLYALLLVCEDYFVPSISCLCSVLKIPENVAGATFMAISTSAPELFTNVIGTFVTKGDLGLGTIMGSAVFNILAVGACIGIGTNFAVKNSPLGGSRPSNKRLKRKVPLDCWPLTRDSFYYLVSIGVLIVVLYDGRVYWQEALIMLMIYCFYIAGMCYDSQCQGMAVTFISNVKRSFSSNRTSSRRISAVIKKVVTVDDNGECSPLISHGSGSNDSCYGSQSALWNDVETNFKPIIPSGLNSKRVSLVEVLSSNKRDVLDSTSVSSSCSSTSSGDSVSSSVVAFGTVKDIISFPLKFAQSWTIPNCKKASNRKLCGVALLSCVAWIGGISYIISWMVCIIGDTFEIPDSVSGLTFLAAGTSLPEVLSSVIVARQGFGSMGLANSIGSNTFDILVCLGLPWLIQAAILTAQDVNYIEIHSGGLEYSAILLVTSLVLLYLVIAANGYNVDTKVGISCVVMYVIFITIACLLEMNVFFQVNLPPC